MEVAERIATGKITRAQGVLELSQLQTQLVDEAGKRSLADRSVRAQEIAAEAAVAPTTCTKCQTASKFDPRSASNFDPLWRRALAVALAPSELVGVAETARARVGV